MTEAATDSASAPKGLKKPLIIGLVLAVIGGAGSFVAVSQGMLSGASTADAGDNAQNVSSLPIAPVAFVAIDPLIISMQGANGRDHLRFAAQLEVDPAHLDEVEAIKPRIVDILNGYLRAVDLAELEDPTALMRLRGQMLRRVQIVAGEGRVKDLLIMEFVLS